MIYLLDSEASFPPTSQDFQIKINQYENEEIKRNSHGTEIPYRTECQVVRNARHIVVNRRDE